MTERVNQYPQSLLEYIAKTYDGLWAGDVLRMVDEGLDPTSRKNQAEYRQRVDNGTLKPIRVQSSNETRRQTERWAMEERLKSIRSTVVIPQDPGSRLPEGTATTLDRDRSSKAKPKEKLFGGW